MNQISISKLDKTEINYIYGGVISDSLAVGLTIGGVGFVCCAKNFMFDLYNSKTNTVDNMINCVMDSGFKIPVAYGIKKSILYYNNRGKVKPE